jgi:hypothetical protein
LDKVVPAFFREFLSALDAACSVFKLGSFIAAKSNRRGRLPVTGAFQFTFSVRGVAGPCASLSAVVFEMESSGFFPAPIWPFASALDGALFAFGFEAVVSGVPSASGRLFVLGLLGDSVLSEGVAAVSATKSDSTVIEATDKDDVDAVSDENESVGDEDDVEAVSDEDNVEAGC